LVVALRSDPPHLFTTSPFGYTHEVVPLALNNNEVAELPAQQHPFLLAPWH
jgi:hypothetical protein